MPNFKAQKYLCYKFKWTRTVPSQIDHFRSSFIPTHLQFHMPNKRFFVTIYYVHESYQTEELLSIVIYEPNGFTNYTGWFGSVLNTSLPPNASYFTIGTCVNHCHAYVYHISTFTPKQVNRLSSITESNFSCPYC